MDRALAELRSMKLLSLSRREFSCVRSRACAKWSRAVRLAAIVLGVFAAGVSPGAESGAATIKWTVTTIAGTGHAGYSGDGGPATKAEFNNPYGLNRGPDGALYVCEVDNHVIRRVDSAGIVSTFAGTGRRGNTGDGGLAREADLGEPYEVRFDAAGNLFFVDMANNLVRRIDAKTHKLSTVAGVGRAGFSGDGGPATQAELKQPHSIQFDHHGDLYICDIGNYRVRKVDLKTGVISTVAGNGQRGAAPDGALILGSPLDGPRAIGFDGRDNLWLALREGNAVYYLDRGAGVIHHVAGSGEKGFTGHGGPALQATLNGPKGLSIGPDGNVYLADTGNHGIRMIDRKRNTLELVAGSGERGDGPDGDALACRFSSPHGIFVDRDGAIYVGDSEAHRVRVIRRVP